MIAQLLDASEGFAIDDPDVGLDLTSMIDMTFLLIIFWLLVTSAAPAEPLRRLELPAATVRQSAGAGRPLILEITAEPVRPIVFVGRAWSAEELAGHLATQPLAGRDVVLRADRRADAALVARIARTCYRNGARSVAFSLQVAGPAGGAASP